MGTHPIFESDFDCLTAMVQRLTYRRTLSYNTSSNRRKIVKTPGGKLVYQHISKAAKAPKCGDTGVPLRGVKAGRPSIGPVLKETEDRQPCLWWFPLILRRPCPHHPRLFDRGTEDCCQGPQGQATGPGCR